MRNRLKREARINRRRACVFGVGLVGSIIAAPYMCEYNPGGIPWVAVYAGALVALLLWAIGQLTPYEDAYHEFTDTYGSVSHNCAWPAHTSYNLTFGPGVTNFVIVEIGVVLVSGTLCLVTGGTMGIGCALICAFAAFMAWLFSSCLKLHWY